ncbi:MAG: hypothetical protein HKN26_07255, partial [Acidimicrobiales bacterium]|nr:hypothetical protein [Acidimicrobiales bacterium]
AVIAIDDTIVALSPIFTYRGQSQTFVALLPPEAIGAGGSHRLDVGWWTESTGLTALELQ